MKRAKKNTKNNTDFKKSIYYEGPENRMSNRTLKELERDIESEKEKMSKMSWPSVYEGV